MSLALNWLTLALRKEAATLGTFLGTVVSKW
jgi:hypothetical protein